MHQEGTKACWQAVGRHEYRRNSVRHWKFGNIVVFQNWQATEITKDVAEQIAGHHRNGTYIHKKIDMNFWDGIEKWKIRKRKW